MEVFITIHEKMIVENNRLEEQIKDLQNQLKQFPTGKLIITHDQNHLKWYVSDGKTSTYLTKAKRPLAEQLAAKKYLSQKLDFLIAEKTAIQFYLRHHHSSKSPDKLLLDSPYQELLLPYFQPDSQMAQNWMREDYDRNTNYPEQLIHKSFSGNVVRSKSEVIIDTALYINKIPYRYECSLPLGDTTLYPDFTILHPVTGKIFYWEHFGMMDNPGYAKNAYSKLQLYNSFDIIPSINLITTFETKEHPLNSELVENIIQTYFL